MNIVFVCDKNYLMPTKVSINSIIKNKSSEDCFCIYIIGVGLSYQDFNEILRMEVEKVSIIPIIQEDCFKQMNIDHEYVSKAALCKFLIPKLIDVDKVLYLDSDILVLKSIRKLYDINLENSYAAVVKDMIAECEYNMQYKQEVDAYFNSGMMLLNLNALRKEKVSDQLLYIRRTDSSNIFMDQDAFNKTFNKKIILLSPEYNYMVTNNRYNSKEFAKYYNISKQEADDIMKYPTVLHLTDRNKPWNSVCNGLCILWYQYAFTEDIPQIISNANAPLKRVVAIQKKELSVQKIKLQQQEENALYYKNNKEFTINDVQLSGVMKIIWNLREDLFRYISQNEEYCKVVIYGAGRMGQAVFKCLWSLQMKDRISGFAVSNKVENIDELYGKEIYELDHYDINNSIVIVSILNYSQQDIKEEIIKKGFKDVVYIQENVLGTVKK